MIGGQSAFNIGVLVFVTFICWIAYLSSFPEIDMQLSRTRRERGGGRRTDAPPSPVGAVGQKPYQPMSSKKLASDDDNEHGAADPSVVILSAKTSHQHISSSVVGAQKAFVALEQLLDATKGAAVGSGADGAKSLPSYAGMFSKWLIDECGAYMGNALYDPLMLPAAALSQQQNDITQNYLQDEKWKWDLGQRFAKPTPPSSYSNLDSQLLLLKRLISIGIGRLHRDERVKNEWDYWVGVLGGKVSEKKAGMTQPPTAADAIVALRAMRSAVRRSIGAYQRQALTDLQLAIDSLDERGNERGDLQRLAKMIHAVGGDPLLDIMGSITFKTKTVADVAAIRAKLSKDPSMHPRRTKSKGLGAYFHLDYHSYQYDRQGPITGKFWNMIRPTASCSSLTRLCETPDGCRSVCNSEYILHADKTHHHRFAGFGSNNEYEWEVSLARLFAQQQLQQQSNTDDNQQASKIGFITTFDCTLKGGKWMPPEILKSGQVGFGHASKCIDQHPNSLSLSMPDVKEFIVGSEKEYWGKVDADKKVEDGRPITNNVDGVTRYSTSSRAQATTQSLLPLAGDTTSSQQNAIEDRKKNMALRPYDDLSILKIDVEGYEFVVMPEWARAELKELGSIYRKEFTQELEKSESGAPSSSSSSDSTSLTYIYPFASSSSSKFFSVGLLQMEFHRMGHRKIYGSGLSGALRAHYLLLHLYSLGFVMVGQEKNHADNCCYEVIWANTRFFTLSETWVHLQN